MAHGPGQDAVPLPIELRGHKQVVDAYVQAKLGQFARLFISRLDANPHEQREALVRASLEEFAALEQPVAPQNLRLVLRHDCQSTGCGEFGCGLCQYNPNRLCTRNLKAKYLIEDHLRAKCGAALRVELVEDSGLCVSAGALTPGGQLEVHVLNGEKYKELCPDNTLLSHAQLMQCMVTHHKALLRREGMPEDQTRVFLQPERGQAALSDLAVTTSSEALLNGKAPTFRLLVWAVDAAGESMPHVTYVVSESFVVATKRVKHAIKSDIPSVVDHVSKIVHIGKATVEKLKDLRSAAAEEGWGEMPLPEHLNAIDKVGDFKQLIELCENNSDLRSKIRHLLKLSPEKWEDVCAHSANAVVPDFRPRVWWCPTPQAAARRSGLLFPCRNGSSSLDSLAAIIREGPKGGEDDQVVPLHQLDSTMFNMLPQLKTQATASWYAPGHPGWAIYWRDNAQDPAMQVAQQLAVQQMAQHHGGGTAGASATLHAVVGQHPHLAVSHSPMMYPPALAALPPSPMPAAAGGGLLDLAAGFMPVGGQAAGRVAAGPPLMATQQQQQRQPSPPPRQTSPFSMTGRGVAPPQTLQQPQQQQQPPQQRPPSQPVHADRGGVTFNPTPHTVPAGHAGVAAATAAGGTSTEHSPFAASGFMADIQDAFPDWPNGHAPPLAAAHPAAPTAAGGAASDAAGPVGFPSIEMLKTEDLVGMEGRASMWALPSLNADMRSVDWLPGLASLQQAGSGAGGALASGLQQDMAAAAQQAAAGAARGMGLLPMPGSLSQHFSMSLDLDRENDA